MRTVKLIIILLASLAVLSLDAGTARALQLIDNFGFDTSITGWSTCCSGLGVASWDATQDVHGSSRSGSAKLAHTAALPANSLRLSMCISGPDVAPGTQLVYGGRLRFPTGQTATGLATVAVGFFASAGCSGSPTFAIGKGYSSGNVTPGAWVGVDELPATGPKVPAGTQSVRLSVVIDKTSAGTLTVDFDDVYLAPVGTPMCDGLPATQVGGPDADFLNGTDQSDVIVGKGSVDWIDGHDGNDRLCGGPGGDVLYGGPGDDRLFGEGGKDTLLGAAGDDRLDGGGNNDTLEGGTGDDVLRGGSGFDTCKDSDAGTKFRACEAVPAS